MFIVDPINILNWLKILLVVNINSTRLLFVVMLRPISTPPDYYSSSCWDQYQLHPIIIRRHVETNINSTRLLFVVTLRPISTHPIIIRRHVETNINSTRLLFLKLCQFEYIQKRKKKSSKISPGIYGLTTITQICLAP